MTIFIKFYCFYNIKAVEIGQAVNSTKIRLNAGRVITDFSDFMQIRLKPRLTCLILFTIVLQDPALAKTRILMFTRTSKEPNQMQVLYKAIKLIGHHARLSDVKDESYPIYVVLVLITLIIYRSTLHLTVAGCTVY